mmetsp:Transcript_2684/g.3986  ORF Transcript_2684/g.3986 Transcript_2684/m.3986 type:complete len:279 (-) Transcript_2684:273-1109(-)
MPSSTEDTIQSLTASTSSKKPKNVEELMDEREHLNESAYFKLFRDLLSKNAGVLKDRISDVSEDYKPEKNILSRAMQLQRTAMILGGCFGIAAFFSLRILPRQFIKRFGSADKIKKLEEADKLSHKHGTAWIQQAVGVLVEGSFSAWLGYTVFKRASQDATGAYELLSSIPLVKGRSVVSDVLCDDMIKLTRSTIPPVFWERLTEGRLKDDQTWQGIRTFSNNCIKRKLYERAIRKELGVSSVEPVSLPNEVPNDTSIEPCLTNEQALALVQDSNSGM